MSGLFDFLRQRVQLEEVRARRPEAVEALFEALAGKLFQYAHSITRRHVDAEEILQDVFMHLVRDPERLRGVRDLKAYLYRAVRNRALNAQRQRGREVLVPMALAGLSEKDLERVVRSALGAEQRALPAPLLERLRADYSGNPAALLETLSAFIQVDMLRLSGGQWVWKDPHAATPHTEPGPLPCRATLIPRNPSPR